MANSNPYIRYYRNQVGGSGEIPVFIGGQHGEGLGDFFRTILRFIAPIALRGISTFTQSTLRAHEGGASLKDAARSAIGPSLSAMASSFNPQQTGSGALFNGDEGVPFGRALVYKGRGKAAKKRNKSKSGKSKSKSKEKVQRHNDDGHSYNF